MSYYTQLLNKVKELGFNISNDNKKAVVTTNEAKDYYEQWHEGKGYILGSVPVDSEQLDLIEYDVAFNVVEESCEYLTKKEYQELHKLAEKNNLESFKAVLNERKEQNCYYEEMIDSVKTWQEGIYEELEEIISDLNKAA